MASPVKAFIDPTGIVSSSMIHSNIKIPSTLSNNISAATYGNRMNAPATLQDIYPRFTIAFPLLDKPRVKVVSSLLTFKESIIKTLVIKTFPSGYHESAKVRPTQGQIYPRKRIKNY